MEQTPPQVNIEHVDGSAPITTSDHAVNDTTNVRIVIVALAVVALAIVVAAAILASIDRAMPDAILALAGVAVGGLSAMLASTASRRT